MPTMFDSGDSHEVSSSATTRPFSVSEALGGDFSSADLAGELVLRRPGGYFSFAPDEASVRPSTKS